MNRSEQSPKRVSQAASARAERRKTLITFWDTHTNVELAAILGTSEEYVKKRAHLLRREGVPLLELKKNRSRMLAIQEARKHLVRSLWEGNTPGEIADAVNTSPVIVEKYAVELKLLPKKPSKGEARKHLVRSLWEGNTPGEIADVLGTSPKIVLADFNNRSSK